MEVSTHLNVRSLSPIKAKLAPSTVSTTSFPMMSGCLEARSLRLVLLPEDRVEVGGGHAVAPPTNQSPVPRPPAPPGRCIGPVPGSSQQSLLSPAPRLKATSLLEFQGNFCSWDSRPPMPGEIQRHLCAPVQGYFRRRFQGYLSVLRVQGQWGKCFLPGIRNSKTLVREPEPVTSG